MSNTSKTPLFRFSVEVWKGGKRDRDIEVEARDWKEARSIARKSGHRLNLGVVRNLGPVENGV